jgi:hypothetical protein
MSSAIVSSPILNSLNLAIVQEFGEQFQIQDNWQDGERDERGIDG